MSLQIDLSGRVALVTGASRGIGRACALVLARAGADVAIHHATNARAAAAVAAEARVLGVRADTLASDHAQSQDGAEIELVRQVVERFGSIDVLVPSAGIWKRAPITEMTAAQLDEMLAINLRAPMLLARAAAARMIAGGRGGSIVFIASTAGQRGEAWHSHYAATKGAVISVTKSLAHELAMHRIRVNCVAPGWVKTDMTRAALGGTAGDEIRRAIPLGDAGEPEDIAHAVAFLASPLAAFVTGEIFNVNGGAVLCG
ncbi:MAG: glucose 1-dehydrogenase [Planctomycetota bacterium]